LGANIGAFTMEMGHRHLRVYSFEMQPWLYTALDLSLRASGYASHVKLFNAALWDTDGAELSFTRFQGNSGATGIGRYTSVVCVTTQPNVAAVLLCS
jgi:FkbM family methyltransferase